MNSDQVLVVDIGTSKVACVSARLEEKSGFSVQALSTAPCSGLKKGLITDSDAVAEAVRAAVTQVVDIVGEGSDELIVSIGGSHVEGMTVQGLKPIVPRGRTITYQDVLEVINHSRSIVLPAEREQIQALPRSFKVDAVRDVQKPIGMTAGKLEVVTYLVTGLISAVQSLNDSITQAGYHIEQMVFAPLAAGIGVLTQNEMELGAIVVDIGAGTTDVGVFSNGSIAYAVSLPVSSTNITNDISQLLKTSLDEAERLKISCASAYSKAVSQTDTVDVLQLGQVQSRPLQKMVLSEIVEARMKEIALMVKAHVEQSGLYESVSGGVVLTGGGARLQGADKVFEEHLGGMKVRLAEPQLPGSMGAQYGTAVAVGLAGFALQCYDELSPAPGSDWKDRVKSLFSMINGR